MRAVLCKEFGLPDTLVLEQVPSPTPGKGEIVVTVKACGVSFPDTLIIQNKYQFKPELPFSPGGEVAGIVKEVGEGVKYFKPGDHVVAFTGWGGYADEVKTTANRVIPMPEGVDFATAAIFVMTYGTAHHALKDRARIAAGETLLVLGAAGGVGLATVQIGKIMGARVIAAASSDEKLAVCRAQGADEIINYQREDLKTRLKELTDGRGVDVIFDPVGGPYSEPALRGIGWKGRHLVVGFAAGDIPKVPVNLALLKGAAIVGVFWGMFTEKESAHNQENLRELLGWLQNGTLKPLISQSYPLERASIALNDMMERKITGKAVLLIE